MIRCSVCSTDVDPRGAAIVNDFRATPNYVGFVEDLRGSPQELRHLSCFVDTQGIEAFFAAVHREDARRRQDELTRRPPLVWIPQATLSGRRDDVNIYDVGAFTSEKVALDAAKAWLEEFGSEHPPEVTLNLVPVYDTIAEWRSDL